MIAGDGKEYNLAFLTAEERRSLASKAGKSSVKARRDKKLLRDCMLALLEGKITTEDGQRITGAEAQALSLFKSALDERDSAKKARAFEVLRDTAGQKPVEKIEQLNTNIVVDFGEDDTP